MEKFYFLFFSCFIRTFSKMKDNPASLEKGEYPIVRKDSNFHKCYYTCSECLNIEPNETNHNCIKCSENYYKLNNGLYPNNCYDNKTIKNILIFEERHYENYNKKRRQQDGSMDTLNWVDRSSQDQISGVSDCPGNAVSMDSMDTKCEKGYYPLIDSPSTCYNNETIQNGYYFDKLCLIWRKCYSKCETCESKGNNINMNCSSCKAEPNSDVKLIDGNCIYECLNNVFISPNGSCVLTCPNGTYQYSYNNSCLESCPNNYEINDDKNKCELKTFFENITVSEIKDQIRSEITSFVDSIKVFSSTNFKAAVLTSDEMNPEEQLKKGISAVDLENCTQVIKEYYNIPQEENLIILNIELKNDESRENENNIEENKSPNLNKITQVEIYDYSGRQLNISVCKEDLKVMKYIGDIDEINIESAKSLSKQGIDLFNPQDSFFNDICCQYDNPDGKDIILNDRRNDMFQNISFCQDGCTYSGMNYELMTAICSCNTSYLQENNDAKSDNVTNIINFKLLADSFISNLFSFNFDVVKCYNLAFNLKILLHNIGFYGMFSMFILQIIFLFIYVIKKLKSVEYFMLQFKNKKNNYKKNNLNNIYIHKRKSINEHNNNKHEKNNKIKLNPSKKKNTKVFIVENKGKINKLKNYEKVKFKKNNIIELKDSESNISNNNSEKTIISDSLQNGAPSNNKLNFGKVSKSKRNLKKDMVIGNNNFSPNIYIQTPVINVEKNLNQNYNFCKGKNNNNIKVINELEIKSAKKNLDNPKINKVIAAKLSEDYYDLQDLDYEKAIIYDKRSYFKMYWEFLVDSQIILGTFCTDNNLDLFIIKLSFFICTFQISFFLNALFYTDEYISDAYHNDGVLDFFSGLPKSIYSFIATLITTNLLGMLSSSKSELVQVIKDKAKYNNYVNIINSKLSKLRLKLIIYFILIYLLGSFFTYYVVAFCAVYRHSQKYWFIGCLESFGMDSLVGLISCIFLALFRFISIKKHLKCLYVLANIISTFL